jgi:methionine-rich copper-binding protein CopC
LLRILFLSLGGLVLATTSCDLLQPRARLTRSEPEAGAILATPPAAVALFFSNALDPSSELRVRRTVTIGPSGEQLATGGTPVARASGPAALGDDGRSLRLLLPAEAGGGLYVADWTATSAAWTHAQRFGSLYFGVGMPVPDFIVRDGVIRERDQNQQDRREAVLAGVVCIALGFLLPRLVSTRKDAR